MKRKGATKIEEMSLAYHFTELLKYNIQHLRFKDNVTK